MFGISLGKVLLIVALAAGAYLAWKYVARRNEVARSDQGGAPTRPQVGAKGGIQELRACPTCGAYVAVKCERKDCPIG